MAVYKRNNEFEHSKIGCKESKMVVERNGNLSFPNHEF